MPGASFWCGGRARARAPVACGRPRCARPARLARPRWWRRPPFLPLPDPDYLRFRLETQYGAAGRPEPDDLVAYLEWCRDMARTQRRGERAPPVDCRAVDAIGGGLGRLGRALLLNASFEPLCVVSVRRAVVLVLKEKAEIVARNGAELHSERLTLPGARR